MLAIERQRPREYLTSGVTVELKDTHCSVATGSQVVESGPNTGLTEGYQPDNDDLKKT